MKKIIDVRPPEQSQRPMNYWLSDAATLADQQRRGALARSIQALIDRIAAAPEVTDTTVLIDTADDERITRLVRLIQEDGINLTTDVGSGRHRLRKALRALDKPPIEEPMLFGAVVRETDGDPWVRLWSGLSAAPAWANGSRVAHWRDLNRPEIEFPGVEQDVPF